MTVCSLPHRVCFWHVKHWQPATSGLDTCRWPTWRMWSFDPSLPSSALPAAAPAAPPDASGGAIGKQSAQASSVAR